MLSKEKQRRDVHAAVSLFMHATGCCVPGGYSWQENTKTDTLRVRFPFFVRMVGLAN
jgi:hypothetical protein